LFLQGFGVPFWGLTHVFGRDDMYWYRLTTAFGRNSIVGTTVKHPESLPGDLLADEKHTKHCGDKVYAAVTAGQDCVLGAAMCQGADSAALSQGYGVFAEEARNLDPDYQAETVNTDGWGATRIAWKTLFVTVQPPHQLPSKSHETRPIKYETMRSQEPSHVAAKPLMERELGICSLANTT
jgi:hypothetical protein